MLLDLTSTFHTLKTTSTAETFDFDCYVFLEKLSELNFSDFLCKTPNKYIHLFNLKNILFESSKLIKDNLILTNKIKELEKIDILSQKYIFAYKLKQLMSEQKLTQKTLSTLLSVSQQNISSYCKGLTYPTMDKLLLLSDILGVSCDYLINPMTEKFLYMNSILYKKLGLSDKSITNLEKTKLYPDLTNSINTLLESYGSETDFISTFNSYLQSNDFDLYILSKQQLLDYKNNIFDALPSKYNLNEFLLLNLQEILIKLKQNY